MTELQYISTLVIATFSTMIASFSLLIYLLDLKKSYRFFVDNNIIKTYNSFHRDYKQKAKTK